MKENINQYFLPINLFSKSQIFKNKLATLMLSKGFSPTLVNLIYSILLSLENPTTLKSQEIINLLRSLKRMLNKFADVNFSLVFIEFKYNYSII